jgi:hypothetical protein
MIGLYYPFIHFKNDAWLKLSALYWDGMARIVPHSYATEDNDTVRALEGFVIDKRPDDVDERFHDIFGEFVRAYEEPLLARYRVADRDKNDWPVVPEERRPPAAGGASGTDPRLAYVYCEKMLEPVQELLKGSKLALEDPEDPRWIGMHPRMTDVYMMALVEQLAGEQKLRPATDEAVDHASMSDLSVERLAQALLGVKLMRLRRSTREVEATAAMVALETVLPEDLATLDPDKINRFRENRSADRKYFQEYIEEFARNAADLRDVRGEQALREHLRAEFDKTLKPRVDELRDELHALEIDTVTSCMNVKVVGPRLLTTGAGAMALDVEPIAAGVAGLAISVLPVLQDARKRAGDLLRPSEITYLHRAERDVAPITLLGRVREQTQRFLLGIR